MTFVPNESKLMVSFRTAWEKLVSDKQTLFPVWQKTAHRGIPPQLNDEEYALRATKSLQGINMRPALQLNIVHSKDDQKFPYTPAEEIRLTLVSAKDKGVPPQGACHFCQGNPILTESKTFHLEQREDGAHAIVKGGSIYFSKLQIGCCTSVRGHGVPFRIKIEFTRADSPLRGIIVYSPPIEVGAKSPFARIEVQKAQMKQLVAQGIIPRDSFRKNSLEDKNPPNVEALLEPSPTKTSPNFSTMMTNQTPVVTVASILDGLELSQYIATFHEQEIDIKAFMQLTDGELIELGINRMGPRLKILNEVARLRGNAEHVPARLAASPSHLVSPSHLMSSPSNLNPPNPTQTLYNPPSVKSEDSSPPSLGWDDPNLFSVPQFADPRRRRTDDYHVPMFGAEHFEDIDIMSNLFPEVNEYVFLSATIQESDTMHKQVLFIVRSCQDHMTTQAAVQGLHEHILQMNKSEGRVVLEEGHARMIIGLVRDPNTGNFVVQFGTRNGELSNADPWPFERGDFIKIDNFSDRITVRMDAISCVIPSGLEATLHIQQDEPFSYPAILPGRSLEIGLWQDPAQGYLEMGLQACTTPNCGSLGGVYKEACTFATRITRFCVKRILSDGVEYGEQQQLQRQMSSSPSNINLKRSASMADLAPI
ncbi:ankyrin repeat and SAM domain-containing protein 3-like [Planoprotostelium fungivorum]|uniref:Ankyrin repeat and SAM domain-containing protein 3-like n=1 Tax=Planoprotostelium fungivorum TaxID=1890364 RepID=A0A2P6NMI4_9EUKA|nr:ankyrin repeat and SAM domain-containing protein 3-like [Planoprotostelium fungivorum]